MQGLDSLLSKSDPPDPTPSWGNTRRSQLSGSTHSAFNATPLPVHPSPPTLLSVVRAGKVVCPNVYTQTWRVMLATCLPVSRNWTTPLCR